MNPNIQQVQGQDQGSVQSLLSCWAGAEVLSGLIHRRRTELRLSATQGTTQSTEITDLEMQELARDAARGSQYFVTEYFNAAREQQQPSQQQRRTA